MFSLGPTLRSEMEFKIKPYKHQLEAIELASKLGSTALFWEMGTGKTGGMINILRYRYNVARRVQKTLILSPSVTLYNWKNEFKIHSNIHEDNILVLEKSGKARVKMLVDNLLDDGTKQFSRDKIIIVNYEALLNEELLKVILTWQPEILICDESHYIKNPSSKRSKAVFKISSKASYRHLLTGTPILNSPMDVFMQYKVLDNGEAFGKNFHVFKRTYFQDENAAWAGRPGYFPKLIPIPEKFPELHERMFKRATRIIKSECLDLPPLVKKVINVEISPEQSKAYQEMKRDFLTFVKNLKQNNELTPITAQLAVTKALRLQQILSGYVKTETGEEIEFKKVPRLEITKELLQNLAPSHKVILWCCFKKNYEQLERICKELNLEYAKLTGEQSTKEKQHEMERFNSEQACRVIIANRRAGGIGINLVSASYSIVYSRNFSLADELQSEARNYRGGSQIHEQIVKIDLCTKGTIDETVLEALTNKQKLSDRIIDLKGEDL